MFNFLKKISADAQTKDSTIIIPTAEELRLQTQSNWKTVSIEDIMDAIVRKQKNGEREAIFSRSYIPREIKNDLEEKGYKVTENEIDNTPWFTIQW